MDSRAIEDNLNQVKEAIEKYKTTEVSIVAATKTQSAETLSKLNRIDSSVIFGENRTQEFLEKYNENYSWQYIGQLQTNKVKYLVGKVDLIQSVDRLNLAESINKEAKKVGVVQNALVEVNIGNEAQKGGISCECLLPFLDSLCGFDNLKIKGLMCIAPNGLEEIKLERLFSRMQEMYFKAKERFYDFSILSMGMSNDFISALKCGSNMVRLGRALFGERV